MKKIRKIFCFTLMFVFITNIIGNDMTTSAYTKSHNRKKAEGYNVFSSSADSIGFTTIKELTYNTNIIPTPTNQVPMTTVTPTVTPTITPTIIPTITPTIIPTIIPTVIPTLTTTITPTVLPIVTPITTPTVATSPTLSPTVSPTPTPKAKTQITILSQPASWCNQSTIKIFFENANGIKSVTVNGKVEFSASGSYLPTEKTLYVSVNQKNLTISVVDANNQTATETYNLHFIDSTVPSITYSIQKGVLYLSATDSDSGVKEIKYSTNGYNYATYNASGINIASGSNTTYYAYAIDTAGNQSNIIQVSNTPVTKVSFEKDYYTVVKYGSIVLTPIITPSNATDKTITWKSSNENIAKVVNGVVTGITEGTAVITATSINGYKATCTVAVTGSNATGISLNEYSVSMKIGERHVIYATVSPSNAVNKSVSWSSSDTSVATVDNGFIYAKKAGTTYIIATTSNGIRAVCFVTVTGQVATSMYLNYSQYTLDIGKKLTLYPSFYPQNAQSETVTYKTSNSSIATVTSYGEIQAIHEGVAVITAISKNNLVATCVITVKEDLSDIRLNYTKKSLYKGNSFKLIVIGTSQSATFKSSKKSVAKVNSYGMVTAKKTGKATITVTVGDKKLKCVITVKKNKRNYHYKIKETRIQTTNLQTTNLQATNTQATKVQATKL